MARNKTGNPNVAVRLIPAERKAIEQLADRLQCNISDVIRLAVRESLNQAGIPILNFPPHENIENAGECGGK
jgi:hypothetical protein